MEVRATGRRVLKSFEWLCSILRDSSGSMTSSIKSLSRGEIVVLQEERLNCDLGMDGRQHGPPNAHNPKKQLCWPSHCWP